LAASKKGLREAQLLGECHEGKKKRKKGQQFYRRNRKKELTCPQEKSPPPQRKTRTARPLGKKKRKALSTKKEKMNDAKNEQGLGGEALASAGEEKEKSRERKLPSC